jgi:hypothetical protein
VASRSGGAARVLRRPRHARGLACRPVGPHALSSGPPHPAAGFRDPRRRVTLLAPPLRPGSAPAPPTPLPSASPSFSGNPPAPAAKAPRVGRRLFVSFARGQGGGGGDGVEAPIPEAEQTGPGRSGAREIGVLSVPVWPTGAWALLDPISSLVSPLGVLACHLPGLGLRFCETGQT